MSWVILSLLAPAFWSVSCYVDKFALENHSRSIVDFLFFFTISGWVLVPVLIVVFGVPTIPFSYSVLPIIMGVLLNLSYGLYAKALQGAETSSILLLAGLIPVFTILFGYIFLGQNLTMSELAASAIIVIGALVVAVDQLLWRCLFKPGILWMLAATLLWSGMYVVIDWLLTKVPFGDYMIFETLGTTLSGLLFLALPKMRALVFEGIKTARPTKYAWFCINNGLDLLGQITVKKALSLAPAAGLVSVVTQVQNFYLIVIGALLTLFVPHYIKEDLGWSNLLRKLVGSVLMFAGLAWLVKSGAY